MGTVRKASIKETGEELSPETWKRFEDATRHVQEDAAAEKLLEQNEAVEKTTPDDASPPG